MNHHETNQGTTDSNQSTVEPEQVRFHLPGARSSLARTHTRESWPPAIDFVMPTGQSALETGFDTSKEPFEALFEKLSVTADLM